MSKENNLKTVREIYEAFGRQDLNSFFSLLSTEIVWELKGPSSIPYAGTYFGIEGVQRFFQILFQVEKLETFEPISFFADGDSVIVQGKESGHSVKTGRSFEVEWVHIFTLASGRVIAWKEYIDTDALALAHSKSVTGYSIPTIFRDWNDRFSL